MMATLMGGRSFEDFIKEQKQVENFYKRIEKQWIEDYQSPDPAIRQRCLDLDFEVACNRYYNFPHNFIFRAKEYFGKNYVVGNIIIMNNYNFTFTLQQQIIASRVVKGKKYPHVKLAGKWWIDPDNIYYNNVTAEVPRKIDVRDLFPEYFR